MLQRWFVDSKQLNCEEYAHFFQELIIFLYFFIAMYSISLIFTQVRYFTLWPLGIFFLIWTSDHAWSMGIQYSFRIKLRAVFQFLIAGFTIGVSVHSPNEVRRPSSQGIHCIFHQKYNYIIFQMWCLPRYMNTVIVCPLLVLHIGITVQHALSTFRFSLRVQKIAVRTTILISVRGLLVGLIWRWLGDNNILLTISLRGPFCSESLLTGRNHYKAVSHIAPPSRETI